MESFSFRQALRSGRTLRGVWLASGSHVAAEIAALSGFDWCLIDLEHGLGSEADALRMIQATARSGLHCVVRAPCPRQDIIGRLLDYGASGIMLPMVSTEEDAVAFAKALRYPPHGKRGMSSSCRAAAYGLDFQDYLAAKAGEVVGIAQIETKEGVANCEAIAATEGVDSLFIGHSDLSLQLGVFKQFDAPEMLAAEKAVLAACHRHGKAPGAILRPSMPGKNSLVANGGLFALGSDIEAIKNSFKALLKTA